MPRNCVRVSPTLLPSMCSTVPSSAGGWAGAAPGCGGGAGGMTPHAHSGRFGGTGLAGAGACCASAYPLTSKSANATRARWIFLIYSPPATACTCRSGRSLAHKAATRSVRAICAKNSAKLQRRVGGDAVFGRLRRIANSCDAMELEMAFTGSANLRPDLISDPKIVGDVNQWFGPAHQRLVHLVVGLRAARLVDGRLSHGRPSAQSDHRTRIQQRGPVAHQEHPVRPQHARPAACGDVQSVQHRKLRSAGPRVQFAAKSCSNEAATHQGAAAHTFNPAPTAVRHYGNGTVPASIDNRKSIRRWRSVALVNVSTPPVPALRWVTLFKTAANESAAPL